MKAQRILLSCHSRGVRGVGEEGRGPHTPRGPFFFSSNLPFTNDNGNITVILKPVKGLPCVEHLILVVHSSQGHAGSGRREGGQG